MRIDIFLGSHQPDLSGGVIVLMTLTRSLLDLGVDARIVAGAPLPQWSELEVPWAVAKGDGVAELVGADAVITGATAAATALRARPGVVAQLCAGYEPHLWPSERERIEAMYRLPTLKLVIAPHLARTFERELGLDATVVGTPVDLDPFFPRERFDPNTRPLRILSVGPELDEPMSPVPFKGISTVLAIVARLSRSEEVELVRVMTKGDRLVEAPEVSEAHVGIPPAEVPPVYRSCHLYLGGSTPAEGLGLPAIEAASSGLASVLPAIPSFLDIPELARAAELYPPGDVAAGTAAVERLLREPERLAALAAAGPTLGLERRFDPIDVARRVLAAIERELP